MQEILDYCASLPQENTLDTCKNGVDDDNNGFTDCNDFSCSRSTNVEVVDYCLSVGENTFDKCKNGIDDDNNGFVDCNDFSCSQSELPDVRAACQESINGDAACQDGLDNDLDGFIDCDDFDCSWDPNITVCPGRRVCE